MHFRLILIISFALLSCSQNNKSNADFDKSDFELEFTMNDGSILFGNKLNLMNPRWLKYHPDSFLVVQELRTKKWIKIIDLKSGKVQELLKSGKGPNELVGAWGINIVDKDIWVYGIQQSKLVKLSPAKNRKFEITRAFNLSKKHVMGGTMVNDSTFVGLSEMGATSRLSFFSGKGELLKETGSFPPFKNDKTHDANNNIFMSSLTALANGDKIVLGCVNTDLIEIYDLRKGFIKRLQGPEGHSFQVKQLTLGDGITINQTIPPFRAYSHSTAFSEGFYIAYCGVEIDKQPSPNVENVVPKEIFFFSWTGVPLKRFVFDIPVIAFDLNISQDKIFCLTNNPEPSIKVFDLE